ncbi:hypothetical protein X732_32140 [Mesorhizobium sp. L2C066B000]|nr:hypothetical protein X732_32140 [Mesorhizobium sp. L2C066B000]
MTDHPDQSIDIAVEYSLITKQHPNTAQIPRFRDFLTQ